MSDDAKITLAVAIVGFIFWTGAFYSWAKSQISELKADLNGIGKKCNEDRAAAQRRYHNVSLAVIQAAPPDKEPEISKLLKEECNQ